MSPKSPSSSSPYKKETLLVLIPFWLATLGGITLGFLFAVINYGAYMYLDRDSGHYWAVAFIIIGIFTLLITIFSAVYRARPGCILFPNAVLFIAWSAILPCSFLLPPYSVDLYQLGAEGVLM
jgi:hypothetical protein